MGDKKQEKFEELLSESLHKIMLKCSENPESELIYHYDCFSEIDSYYLFKRYIDKDFDDRRIRCVSNKYRRKPVS